MPSLPYSAGTLVLQSKSVLASELLNFNLLFKVNFYFKYTKKNSVPHLVLEVQPYLYSVNIVDEIAGGK
jgi:hypothetical protein